MPGADYEPVIRIEGEAEVVHFYEWMNTPMTPAQERAVQRGLYRLALRACNGDTKRAREFFCQEKVHLS
jgi:hypothetical protein